MKKTHLLQNSVKTNEILTFPFLRSVYRPKGGAITNRRKRMKTQISQNSVKTNEILIFPSLRIMFQWCLALCWLFLVWFGVSRHWGNFLFSRNALVVSHPLLTVSGIFWGETPLGQFSVLEKCPSGVSPSVDCFCI